LDFPEKLKGFENLNVNSIFCGKFFSAFNTDTGIYVAGKQGLKNFSFFKITDLVYEGLYRSGNKAIAILRPI